MNNYNITGLKSDDDSSPRSYNLCETKQDFKFSNTNSQDLKTSFSRSDIKKMKKFESKLIKEKRYHEFQR